MKGIYLGNLQDREGSGTCIEAANGDLLVPHLPIGLILKALEGLKPSPFTVERSAVRALPSLARTSSLKVEAGAGKKIKTDKPYGINGGLALKDGVDASGRKAKGKGVYQFTNKYGANVDGYSPIYNENEWSPSGDVYTGGETGLAIWAVTLAGLLAGGALLVYNTSALAQ